MKVCKMLGCEKPVEAKGLCPMHYRRFRLYGDPAIVKQHKFTGLSVEERFWKYVKKAANQDDCWLWVGNKHRQGYGQLWVGKSQQLAHRLSWLFHYGEVPQGKHVLHKCDNPPCVNPNHLFLGTQQINMADMIAKRRARPGCSFGSGDANIQAKITESIVREIRQSNEPPRYFTEKYGITRANTWCIRTRKSWKHID